MNGKDIPVQEQQWYYLTHSLRDKGVQTFSMGISPKGNEIAWLKLKLVYYDVKSITLSMLRANPVYGCNNL